jgi:hypothetical protein
MKLTKAQRTLLTDLPVYHLAGSTRAMASRLLADGLVRYTPETTNLHEKWSLTRAGRAALAQAEGR